MLLIHFASNWNNFLKHFISGDFWLREALVQSALRKELFIPPFVKRFKYSNIGKFLIRDCASTRNNLPKHCISAYIMLIEG